MTHRQRLTPLVGQRERAAARVARIAQGEILTPLPAPGVYASSNALDVAALGPDGRPARVLGPARAADPRPGALDRRGPCSHDQQTGTAIGAAPSAPALTEETES